MKIAILISDLSISGGAQRQALELANFLSKRGNEVKVYCGYLDKNLCHPELIKDTTVYGLFGKKEITSKNIFYRFFAPLLEWVFWTKRNNQLIDLMDKNFDIINPHDDIVCEAASHYKDKYNTPIVLTLNDVPAWRNEISIKGNIIVEHAFKKMLYYFRGFFIMQRANKKIMSNADEIVVLDYMNKRQLKDNFGLDANIIRSGLDIKKFKYKKRNSILIGRKINILAVSIFLSHRRFEYLVGAVPYLINKGYDVNLTIIGSEKLDPNYSKKIHNLVKELNIIDYVNFMGEVTDDELLENYHTSDIFVFPNYPQTWGLAVFEAMACGTPTIVSRGCGASEILNDGENSLLISQESSSLEIANSIEQLITDEKLWEKLSVNGRKFVEGNISWSTYGENMLKLFKDAINKTP